MCKWKQSTGDCESTLALKTHNQSQPKSETVNTSGSTFGDLSPQKLKQIAVPVSKPSLHKGRYFGLTIVGAVQRIFLPSMCLHLVWWLVPLGPELSLSQLLLIKWPCWLNMWQHVGSVADSSDPSFYCVRHAFFVSASDTFAPYERGLWFEPQPGQNWLQGTFMFKPPSAQVMVNPRIVSLLWCIHLGFKTHRQSQPKSKNREYQRPHKMVTLSPQKKRICASYVSLNVYSQGKFETK